MQPEAEVREDERATALWATGNKHVTLTPHRISVDDRVVQSAHTADALKNQEKPAVGGWPLNSGCDPLCPLQFRPPTLSTTTKIALGDGSASSSSSSSSCSSSSSAQHHRTSIVMKNESDTTPPREGSFQLLLRLGLNISWTSSC